MTFGWRCPQGPRQRHQGRRSEPCGEQLNLLHAVDARPMWSSDPACEGPAWLHPWPNP
jgi:hypothetical protein